MAIETTKQPYEFLVRWDQSGHMVGAHVVWRYVSRDGKAMVAESVTPAEPVNVGKGNGFPLADILSTAQADAIAAMDAMRAERDAAMRRAESAEAKLAMVSRDRSRP